jgi:tetratricopeptide (TPR) repeat protein
MPRAVHPPEAPRSDRAFARHAAAIFAVALVVRLLHVWLLSRSRYFDALLGDARGYDEWARRIAAGDWIGTDVFYQAPLYPYFLGTIYSIVGHSLTAVRVAQALVGAVSCACLGLAGYRFFSTRVGLVAGFGLALYAPAIFFDALIQKSVLDLCFVALGLWLMGRLVELPGSRGTWAALGVAMGALSLTRENALVFVAVILAWVLVRRTAEVRLMPDATTAEGRLTRDTATVEVPLATRLRGAAWFLAGLAIVLLPVAARNYAVGGGFYLTTAQFGPNFYIGNNPQSDGTYMSLRFGRGAPEYERIDATELAEHALGRPLTPAEVSQYWTDKAFAFITGSPGAYLTLQARKVALLLNATEMIDTESQESHAEWSWVLRVGGWVGHFGLLVPLGLAGALLTWRDRSRLAILHVMTVAYAASVVMFYVFARYRLPLVPLLLLFAAAAVTGLPAWWRATNGPGRLRLGAAVGASAAIAFWPLLSTTEMRAISETNLAVALQADGKLEQAEAHYLRAIDLQPDYAPAYNNLGVMQRAAGRVDEAIATYRRAIELRGDYPDAHYNLANALLQQNRAQEAAEHFEIALKSIPDSAGVRNNLGIALAAQNRPADAAAAFRAAVAAEPKSAVAHRNLADALSEAGQVTEALAEYRIASTLDPNDLSARYNYGVALLEAGLTADAIVELRAAVALSPQSVDALNNLGIALGSSGDLDGAIAQFRRALALDPASTEARSNLETAERARAQMGVRPR